MRLWIVVFAIISSGFVLSLTPSASALPGEEWCPKTTWHEWTPPSWEMDATQGACIDGFVVDPDDCVCMLLFTRGSCGKT